MFAYIFCEMRDNMTLCVLGIGYSVDEYRTIAAEWEKYGLTFDYADNIRQAAAMLKSKEYICVAICTDVIPQGDLDALRKVRSVPIVVVPPSYSETQRYACVHFGAAQYLHTYNHPLAAATTNQNGMQNYLSIPMDKRKPLTIITVEDLSFCLEYRSVEVAGKRIELTEKEFDILALLIMDQRKVFTYEMIMDTVWQEDISFYSPKAITTHISNLRRKLKTAPSIPEYIKSVRGIGYKFEVPK